MTEEVPDPIKQASDPNLRGSRSCSDKSSEESSVMRNAQS